MGQSQTSQLREIASAVRRQRDVGLSDSQIIRAVADLIRRAFELGAFQAGPFAAAGDRIRPWFTGGQSETAPLADGIKTPLWVPIVFYAVLDAVGPRELFDKRQEWIRKHAPRPNMNVRVTKAELAAVADAIDSEAARIDLGSKVPCQLERLADDLTPQRYRILVYLWDQPSGASFDSLAEIPRAFRGRPADGAIVKALERIGAYLASHTDLGLAIQISKTKRRAKIIRPSDK
jgi:hypothetical protein